MLLLSAWLLGLRLAICVRPASFLLRRLLLRRRLYTDATCCKAAPIRYASVRHVCRQRAAGLLGGGFLLLPLLLLPPTLLLPPLPLLLPSLPLLPSLLLPLFLLLLLLLLRWQKVMMAAALPSGGSGCLRRSSSWRADWAEPLQPHSGRFDVVGSSAHPSQPVGSGRSDGRSNTIIFSEDVETTRAVADRGRNCV